MTSVSPITFDNDDENISFRYCSDGIFKLGSVSVHNIVHRSEIEASLRIPSLQYLKEMFSSFCLIWVFRVNSSQSSLNLVSTSSMELY